MSENVTFIDAAWGGLGDAGRLAMEAILATDAALRNMLAHTGMSYAAQSWLFAIATATIVIILMNQLRYLIRGGILLIASLMAVELVKPAFIAIGARLLMIH